MPELQRFTTEFIDFEDRIRLCGESAPGEALVLWLTQRMIYRLVPHLLAWLEQEARLTGSTASAVQTDVLHSFAQQAVIASLHAQTPVQAHTAQKAWLVHSVDVTATSQLVHLIFKGANTSTLEQACVSMQTQALRQWLSILYGQCRRAGWVGTTGHISVFNWPDWLQTSPSDDPGVNLLH